MAQSIKLGNDTLLDPSGVGNSRGVLPFFKVIKDATLTTTTGAYVIPLSTWSLNANDALFFQQRYNSGVNGYSFTTQVSNNNLIVYIRNPDGTLPADNTQIKVNILVVA